MLIALLWYCLQPAAYGADPASTTPRTLQVEARLRLDRKACAPGESVELNGLLANVGKVDVKLPGSDFARQYAFVHLHVVTPKGEEFLYDPYADHSLRSSVMAISAKSFVTNLASTAQHSAFQKALRVTDGLTGWSSSEHPHGPLSLRTPGDYRIWFEYHVPDVAGAPNDAWIGTVKSNTVILSVAELKPNDKLEQPTAEQLTAIAELQHAAPTSIEGRDILQQAMMRGQNEALAGRLIDLCLQDAPRSMDFITMVSYRACNLDPEQGMTGSLQLGIDDPYLKRAALAAIEAFTEPTKDPNHLRVFRSAYGVDIAIAYLRFHSDDRATWDRLVKLARQSASLPPPIPGSAARSIKTAKPQEPLSPALSTDAAWQVLLELGVLHAGMTVDEAIEILGPPPYRSEESLMWYIDTPRHVNPSLGAVVEQGRIVGFRRNFH
jgi:hypothetical protein